MRFLLAFAFIAISFTNISAQHEYSPIQEREVKYLDWTYKSVTDGKEINFNNFSKGKKLVMIVYFAPWCPNWKYQAPLTEALYQKYKDKGFDVIGISEYASIEDVKKQIAEKGLTFPIVSESDSRDAKQKTLHYGYRMKTGDTRSWGSPWNVFILPEKIKNGDEFLTKKAFIVNGEFIKDETESFVRKHLGLPDETKKTSNRRKQTDRGLHRKRAGNYFEKTLNFYGKATRFAVSFSITRSSVFPEAVKFPFIA